MIEFADSGAASPETLEGQTKADPFGGLGDFMGDRTSGPPPAPQMPNVGVDADGELVEMDFGDFDGAGSLARIFGVQPPATIPEEGSEGVEGTGSAVAPAQAGEAQPAQPATPVADDILNQLAEPEREVVTRFRSGTLTKELYMISEFQKNPVEFVDKYVPEIKAQIIHRAAAQVMSPSEYATQYADARLTEIYGENFEFNPADIAIQGSDSARYFVDKQTLLSEGMMQHQTLRQQEAQEQVQKQIEVEQIAKAVLVRQGIPADQYAEVIRIAESLPATPETYYEMLFTFLRAKQLVKPTAAPARTAQPSTHTATGRPGQALPPSLPNGGGRMTTAQASAEIKELNDLFGGML